MTEEAYKYYDLLSASWRPRNVRRVIQPKPEKYRWRGVGEGKLLLLQILEFEGPRMKAGKDRNPSSRREREFTLPVPFCFIQALDDAHPHW